MQLLHSFTYILQELSVVTIDESLISYQPKKHIKEKSETSGEPIPVVFIKRKPHPNGLLIYNAATYIEHPTEINSKLCFLLYMVPHLEPNNVSAISSVETIMNKYQISKFNIYFFSWSFETKPLFVCDSGFGTMSLLEKINLWGGTAVLSISTKHSEELSSFLKYNLAPNHWRVVVNPQGFIFSISCIKNTETKSLVYKAVISNAFTVNKLSLGTTDITPLDEPESK